MKYFYVLILIMIASISIADDKEQLIVVDREFSQLSADSGAAFAFDFYMADSATVLSDGSLPLTGHDAIMEMYNGLPEGASLLWEPIFADISSSGDLGYTIGSWTYTIAIPGGAPTSSGGYYITIWKKQEDGSWKYVFDTGTEGPTE